MNKQTLAIDFDGVIVRSTGPWQGIALVVGDPMPGVQDALRILHHKYTIVVHSSRAVHKDGHNAIRRFMQRHNLPYDEITDRKIDAVAYIDDRAFLFRGWKYVVEAFQ